VNDLQFLTGPSVSDIDPTAPGQEILEGSASMDLNAFTAAGTEVSGWPKMTTDWTIANPTVGSFGTLDTDAAAHKVVIGLTRSGYINAYTTAAPACSPSAWPRFHHDNANSGDAQRDATLPGAPYNANVANGAISFRAPGDDLMCGTADHYELVTSDQPITAQNFADATSLSGAPGPAAPGTKESFAPSAGVKRYVAIRAVDEQGNVGRPLSVDFLGPPKPPPAPCSNVINGTNHADVLRGTAQGDRISGGGGDDKLFGNGGDDCLRGGPGDDRAFGGAGDDVIRVRGAGHDYVRCGAGDDTAYIGRHDHADPSCEDVKSGR
jgi:hypothetical protein